MIITDLTQHCTNSIVLVGFANGNEMLAKFLIQVNDEVYFALDRNTRVIVPIQELAYIKRVKA